MTTETPLRLQLLGLADAYAVAKGLSRARVSTIVFNGGMVLDRIANAGTDITTGTLERAVLWFSANWPDGVAWPEGLARPAVTPSTTEAA